MSKAFEQVIRPAAVQRFLRELGWRDAELIGMQPLGRGTQASLKSYGYGRPLLLTFTAGGHEERLVLRTMGADPFGHERRSDRAAVMISAFDTFGGDPRHVRPVAAGAFDADGELSALPAGEPFVLTTYEDGRLYADDLQRCAELEVASAADLARAAALARHLAWLHEQPAPEGWGRRTARDLVGSGEGIFGLCDSYPDDHPVASLPRLRAIEHAAVDWRWRLRALARLPRQTHGDFHPFNILFRHGVDFTLLDRSRGGAGDPADDVTCLSVNYLFFALAHRPRFDGALRQLWEGFWASYLAQRHDEQLLQVVAPFFTWRLLVVASPVWYPDVADEVRERLLRLSERLLAGWRFSPHDIDEALA